MAAHVKDIALIFLPHKCYVEFFIKLNYFDVDCLKIAISKILGIGIILGSILVKLPQIIKMWRAKSAQGISFLGVIMELAAASVAVAYSLAKGFPFSSWGEGSFLVIQTMIIGALLLYFEYSIAHMIVFLSLYFTGLCLLLSQYTPVSILAALQAINVPIIVSSKMIQASVNFQNESTGQLSATTIFLTLAGSLARIFTSIQETGDFLIILTYICGSVANAILAFQIAYYWGNDAPTTSRTKID